MTTPIRLVLLLDVDNSLPDHDRNKKDVNDHPQRKFGSDCSRRYGETVEALRAELGNTDYAAISERFPATHRALVDAKLRTLQVMKRTLGLRLTTLFPRQEKYALDPDNIRDYAAADITVETIGGLPGRDFSALIDASRCAAPTIARQA